MITTFHQKRIRGVLGVLPENEYDYDEETKPFQDIHTKRLKRIMGYGKRRAAKSKTTTSDLCVYGFDYVLKHNWIKKEEIGAVVVVTISPDHYVPHVSNIIHGEFDLPHDVVCVDIPQACAGYIMGLMEACMLLEHMPKDKKVVLFTGDVLCRKEKETPLAYPSFGGDGASVSIIENDSEAGDIFLSLYNDGANRNALIIPAGGFRLPRSPETDVMMDIGDGTMRTQNCMWMDGSGVFNFVQREVPPMVEELLSYGDISVDDVDWFLFHQPNKFMLQKLADKMKVPYEKMPMNVVGDFGNSNSNTVPFALASNLSEEIKENSYRCCLAGFGAGLCWGAALLELGDLDFCEMTISNL